MFAANLTHIRDYVSRRTRDFPDTLSHAGYTAAAEEARRGQKPCSRGRSSVPEGSGGRRDAGCDRFRALSKERKKEMTRGMVGPQRR